MQQQKPWWKRPLRVIQPNLQVLDTARIDPERLASQLSDMGANAVVFNVGGIYAWYRSEVAYHHVNEHLPSEPGADLLRDVIDACRKRNIRFIARYDFSKAADWIYLRQPQWFVRKAGGEPETIGAKRPGNWSLLMTTCINGGFRSDAVAIPVLDESLGRYDIDGVFFNNPQYQACECDGCKRKYEAVYGKAFPESPALCEPDWATLSMRDNMERMYRFIKEKREEVPMILYYNLYRDNLFDRMKTTDMLCTESQDVLSLGHRDIPEFWHPALSMKLGRSAEGRPAPFGIVHSSPGMDWRHTGLPPAEYAFWLAQIPAHGGSIWHSLTGVPDTIRDKRIIRTVSELNHNAAKVEPYMEDAVSVKETALLWNAQKSAEGWADALVQLQLPFDVLLDEQAVPEVLRQYRVLVVPEGYAVTQSFAERIRGFVEGGGQLIAEGEWPLGSWELNGLFGVSRETYAGESLVASYLRIEDGEPLLRQGFEDTEWIAHRGRVIYTRPERAETLATLVPPFSPLESVGAPPERASHAVDRTDIPLLMRSTAGKGRAWYFPFSLSHLINAYRLGEHYRLIGNVLDAALGGDRLLRVTPYPGLQATAYRIAQLSQAHGQGQGLLVHLVNGAGRRPLAAALPLHEVELDIRLPEGVEASGVCVEALLGGVSLPYSIAEGRLRTTVKQLDVWECLAITYA